MSAWEIAGLSALLTAGLGLLILNAVVTYLDRLDRDAEAEAVEAIELGNSWRAES